MKSLITLGCSSALLLTACQHTANLPQTARVQAHQSDAEIVACMQTIMKLDEGRWDYMGTIAQLGGRFRTYAATSVHATAGPDMWSSKAFGGDFGGDESSADISYVKRVGTAMIPLTDGKLNEAESVNYTSCLGPDPEGRYQATTEYKMPNGDGTFDTSYSTNWYSEHGSYYAEDHYNEEGRIVSRRSGVNKPASKK